MTREFVEFPFLLFIRVSISSVGHLPGGGPKPCITDSFITRVLNWLYLFQMKVPGLPNTLAETSPFIYQRGTVLMGSLNILLLAEDLTYNF